MKKTYNIPATEVVAFVSGMIMDLTSPVTPTQDPADPNHFPPGVGDVIGGN